jgi:hypothetical protein
MMRILILAFAFVAVCFVSAPASSATLQDDLNGLTPVATSISQTAIGGNWPATTSKAGLLEKRWGQLRPKVATNRLLRAHAETMDAALAWMKAALAQRSSKSTRDAATMVTKTVHEIGEDL